MSRKLLWVWATLPMAAAFGQLVPDAYGATSSLPALAPPVSASQASSVDASGWGLIAAITTAVVAVATLVFRELARRRTDLDQKVANAVSASIGNTLLTLREFETKAKTSLEETTKSAADIELHLKERLQISEGETKRLNDLLERASSVVPTLETSRAAIPSLLLYEARNAPLAEALNYLSSLLAADEATPQDLENGGDLAKDKLGADALALALFEKAIDRNPALVGSRAIVLGLRARAGTQSLADARRELTELALANQTNRRVVVAATNHFNEFEDYKAMLDLMDQLLASDPERALFLRNRAVALEKLGRDAEAAEAYTAGYKISQDAGDLTELANIVRPYAPFLMRKANYADAQTVLEGALAYEPENGWLLKQLGELWDLLDEDERARRCFEAALKVTSNPSEQALVAIPFKRLVTREQLVKEGILRDPERHSVGTEAHEVAVGTGIQASHALAGEMAEPAT